MEKKVRADFMSDSNKKAMGDMPRRHDVCKELTGVMRPGKTAKDRHNRSNQGVDE